MLISHSNPKPSPWFMSPQQEDRAVDDLDIGDVVLVGGILTHEGVKIGDTIVPACKAEVVTDLPKFTGLVDPVALLLFFSDDEGRQEFAAAYRGLPDIELRDL